MTKRECTGLVDRLGLPILYIINQTKVSSDELCSVLMGHECSTFLNRTYSNMTFWNMALPPKQHLFKQPYANTNLKFKILHLTDVHLDLFYAPDSNAKCNEPLCCRATSYGQNYSAGYWGEVNGVCDIPFQLVESSLRQIKQKHPDIDLIFWTGDNVPHDIWNTSKEMSLKHNSVMAMLMKKTFSNVEILPALGNHEAHPINL